jgi:hypothetical protein
VGLFGNKEEKRSQEAAAEVESRRLAGLPVADLAAEVLPAFGPEGINAGGGGQEGPMEVAKWLLASTSSKAKYKGVILGPVVEALQLLDNKGLVGRRSFGASSSGSTYDLTRLGKEALADGSVEKYL